MAPQTAAASIQKPSQRFHRGSGWVASRTGNVSAQTNNPFESVKLANTAKEAQIQNFAPIDSPFRITQRPQTMQHAATNEGKPEASNQSSCCAGEKISNTLIRKTRMVA